MQWKFSHPYVGERPKQLKVEKLASQPIADIFCNFINPSELCCLAVLPTSATAKQQWYSVFEVLLSEQQATMLVHVPTMIYSNYRVQDAILTKNSVVFSVSQQLHICSRRTEAGVIQRIDLGEDIDPEEVRRIRQDCYRMKSSSIINVNSIEEYYLEENADSVIDGYILTATSNTQAGLQYAIRPLLVAGPHYRVSVQLDVERSACDRYLTSCAQTTVQFAAAGRASVSKRAYVVGPTFTSVILKSKTGRLGSYIDNGRYMFSLSD